MVTRIGTRIAFSRPSGRLCLGANEVRQGRDYTGIRDTNPFYIGLFRYKCEIHEGVHEAIVSKQVFDLLVEGTITRDEYALRKGKYVTAKANLKDRIAQTEAKGADWLEPLETFIHHCKQAKRVAFSENLEELKEFLQLIGSNLVLTGPIDDDHPAVAAILRGRLIGLCA